jgi:tRNA-specific 2-thiouridylase
MRVLAAMSGGVDSAVAAARAVDAGHDVVGVHLALSRMPGTLRTGSRGCCTIEDSMDAQRAANVLGIPYYVWDFSERFKLDVVDDFVAEYTAGRTPNPCMRCNERIKFAALLEKALALGFDAVCTGHYADIRTDADGNRELHRAASWAKDQSYVLGVLTEQQLKHAMFPLGATPSKAEVRAEAAARGLSVANKPDSHDICFIPDGDTRGWLSDRLGTAAGEIVERDGSVVGSHEGSHGYTIGQRRGLSLGRPAADGKPRFVLEIHPKENRVVVGPKEALDIAEIAGRRMSWAGRVPDFVTEPFECEVQIRAHADPVPATAVLRPATPVAEPASVAQPGPTPPVPDDSQNLPAVPVGSEAPAQSNLELLITPHIPLNGVAPGQTAVVYLGTRVLGQCTIDRTVSALPLPTPVSAAS